MTKVSGWLKQLESVEWIELLILNCCNRDYLDAVTVAARGPRAAQTQAEGQRGKCTLRWVIAFIRRCYDEVSAKMMLLLAFQMQQLELAQIRQREANLTALAAIGPRKKRKMDSPIQGASAEVKSGETERLCLKNGLRDSQQNVFLLFIRFAHQGLGSGASQPGGSGGAGSRQFMRQRITRVNLRDLLFCLENERGTGHSQLLYKGFLK